ncbi:MAG: hypothetical protein RMX96_13460 [Nostoc sp. ChiSLP02]|nr:hypothetical protein [Nostoc sp. DedSLP05]MDZ8098977.1 hypothetical protein [Nostoc sp. DedSLP01]MDZ8185847.1 hypothetical protein [Nostoc sp. ChiSLP02]
MTSSADEIQRLIADIDNLLASGGKRVSRFLSGQGQEPKEVLERIRGFLAKLQEKEALDSGIQNQSLREQPSPLLTKLSDRSQDRLFLPPSDPTQEYSSSEAEQLKTDFSRLIQPLRAELEGLLQERAALVQEIRLLEQKRLQNYSLAQQLTNQEQTITEFLQVLMSRLVPTLTPIVGQTSPESDRQNSEPVSFTTQPYLESPDRVQRLNQLAQDLDQRLLSLDGTVNVVFNALQRNINTYYESLSQALARMHSQGMQGEQLMASFLNNLTQYLQQQSPSSPFSFLGIETETSLASEPQSPDINAEASLQLLDLIQPDKTNAEQQNTSLTEDFDAVLLQLGLDPSPSSENEAELPEEISALIADEVDQLYASLFGTSNDSLAAATTSPSTLDIPEETPVVSPTLNLEILASDTFFAQPNAGISNVGNAQAASETIDSQEGLFFAEDTGQASAPEISAANSLPIQLETELEVDEIINNLTDLLPDGVTDGELQEVQPTVSNAITTPAIAPEILEITLAKAIEGVATDDTSDSQEPSLDNYIPASPQENLLSVESNQAPVIHDISLDEQQLQQLDRDLANFDRQLNSEFEPITNLDVVPESISETQDTIPTIFPEQPSENLEITANTFAIPQVETDLYIEPKTEKKNQQTSRVSESYVPPTSNLIDNREVSSNILKSVWYLGIDLGTTGISAALLDSSSLVVHPIYWSTENSSTTTSFQQSFRLPTEVYLPIASIPHSEHESNETHEQTAPAAVARDKNPAPARATGDSTNNLYSAQLKPYLQLAIPYKSEKQKWEPVLQLNEFSAGPLIWVVRSLSKLLLTLKSDRGSTTPSLIAAAVGISEESFPQILNNIAGVICTCPSNWSEQYRFNVREAILTSKLVQHPQQVFFVEEAIASLLPELDTAKGEQIKLKLSPEQDSHPAKTTENSFVGNTLVINIGAAATEMLLVDVPESLGQLTYSDFMLHSFAYSGKGIEQDIICQLLLPPKSRRTRTETPSQNKTATTNPWQWQPSIPGLDQMHWQSLGLEELELPRVGEPDIKARIRLQQRLESSLLGQAVLDAALALKLILQHQDSFTLELGDRQWILERRDLESQVFIPFVRRLNRELNKLLVARGIPTEAINQAILTGGVASVGTVNRWLRQKLPSAKIIQDLYLGENGAPNCSRVAYGLAMLPLHPQVLDIPRQQYTDYFLFTELLRVLPDRPLSFGEVIQLFESRGINTRTCQQRLLAFLEGELPSGLIPSVTDSSWLTHSSQENLDYQAIAATPLFDKQGSLTYRPNSQQLTSLRRYLDAIKASNQQSLEEPYTVNFALEVHN